MILTRLIILILGLKIGDGIANKFKGRQLQVGLLRAAGATVPRANPEVAGLVLSTSIKDAVKEIGPTKVNSMVFKRLSMNQSGIGMSINGQVGHEHLLARKKILTPMTIKAPNFHNPARK